jgi:hypothetical protein
MVALVGHRNLINYTRNLFLDCIFFFVLLSIVGCIIRDEGVDKTYECGD